MVEVESGMSLKDTLKATNFSLSKVLPIEKIIREETTHL